MGIVNNMSITKHWVVPVQYDPDSPAIREAAALIRAGQTVAFPTETVYGLGADARQPEAVEAIFAAKGRPSDNPLIVHISSLEQLDELAERVDDLSMKLARTFWPGPLTLVLPVKEGAVSSRVTAGLDTVAVRMPDHPVALSLIAAAGCPIAAPSANRSGRPSPTLAAHVREDLDGRIAGILDGGPTGVGIESTVVQADAASGRLHLLRPGGITREQLEKVAGMPIVSPGLDATSRETRLLEERDGQDTSAPRSPGMKYTHYAPRGTLTVVQGSTWEAVRDYIQRQIDLASAAGHRTGVLAPREHAGAYRADLVLACGSLDDPAAIARELFANLRKFDEANIGFMFSEAISEEGMGLAVMNRLIKAAGHRIVQLP